MKNYILTYTKTRFEPLQPVMEDIHIEDIAHSLSMLARANGHFPQFYSVGQHSLNCYKEAKARRYPFRVQLGCLLHDASECYISDLTRPVKCQLPEYVIVEKKLQDMIFQRFGLSDLTEEELVYITEVDDTLLYCEFMESMGEPPVVAEPPYVALKHDFSQREMASIEKEFLYIFRNLTEGEKCMDPTPFSLEISFSDNLELTATLKNISDSTYKFQHHKYAAPIELKIVSENGDTLPFYDKRKRMRYHIKSDINSSRTLYPPDSTILNRKSFEKESDRLYLLNWDAFVYRSIKPGEYTVTAQWRSRIDSCYDAQKKEFVLVDKVWKVTIVSNTITITLP